MIVSNLQNSERIEKLHPLFKELFAYIKSHDLLHMECGRIEIKGDDLFINNDNPTCIPQDKQVLELHRKYIDVQLLLEGKERIGWKAIEDLKEEYKPYDEARDCAFYSDRPTTFVDLQPGQFVILYPEDPHAPIIGEGKVRKMVAKVRYDY